MKTNLTNLIKSFSKLNSLVKINPKKLNYYHDNQETAYSKNELNKLISSYNYYSLLLNTGHDYHKLEKERKNIKFLTIGNIIQFLNIEKEVELFLNKDFFSYDLAFRNIIINNTDIDDNIILTNYLFFYSQYPTDHILFESLFENRIKLLLDYMNKKSFGFIDVLPEISSILKTLSKVNIKKYVSDIDENKENKYIVTFIYRLISFLNTSKSENINDSKESKMLTDLIYYITYDNKIKESLFEILLALDGISINYIDDNIVENYNEISNNGYISTIYNKDKEINHKKTSSYVELDLKRNFIYKIILSNSIDKNKFNNIYNLIKVKTKSKEEDEDESIDEYIFYLIKIYSDVIILYTEYNQSKDKNNKSNEDYLILKDRLNEIRFEDLIHIIDITSKYLTKKNSTLLKLSFTLFNIKNLFGSTCSIDNILKLILYINRTSNHEHIEYISSFICYNLIQHFNSQLKTDVVMIKIIPIFIFLNRMYNLVNRRISELESVIEFVKLFERSIYNNLSLGNEEFEVKVYDMLIDEIMFSFEIEKKPLVSKEFVLFIFKNKEIINDISRRD